MSRNEIADDAAVEQLAFHGLGEDAGCHARIGAGYEERVRLLSTSGQPSKHRLVLPKFLESKPVHPFQ